MEKIDSPPPCPDTVTVRRNPHRRARPRATPATAAPEIQNPSSSVVPQVLAFPTEDILSMDIGKPNPVSENLRVFLRIRPLVRGGVDGDRNPKPKLKNVWPQNPAKRNTAIERSLQNKKKKNSEVCVRVNTSQSVTLSPPPALQENNRIKTEVYDGFSHVFSADSSQEEVYEKTVKPLVEDFLRGKSGMLAALGPSGSGKTHTVFGSNRHPGMVPLALQQIFKQSLDRSFFISIFEISSEGGKGERLFDLSPNGGDLSMQKSTLKGLQEIPISNAGQAESLVAQAMLKRSTGMTNTNSQSSRSQCIINIRGIADKSNGKDNDQANDSVLSIVDLAGAEREKRTGNQGARLIESNFINNTSMVIGLCLRSLLEHQKNPKKPLQKHFQNSSLTKYLRDYLEGKKRMALILTVKSGEEDYRDTSYVLRQASPYMEIKYNNVEERSNISYNKRHFQASSRSEQPKRMKVASSDASVIEEAKGTGAENTLSEKSFIKSTEDPGICKVGMSDFESSKPRCLDSGQGERNNQIMQNFAKAIWNVLKEYKEKLKVSDNEIQHLSESLVTEHARNLELQKELMDIKSYCSCSNRKPVEVSLTEVDTNLRERVQLECHEPSNKDETSYSRECDSNRALKICDSTPNKDNTNFSQVKEGAFPFNLKGFGCVDIGEDIDATLRQNNEQQIDATVKSLDAGEVASCLEPQNPNQQDHQTCERLSGSGHSDENLCDSNSVRLEDSFLTTDVEGFTVNSSQSLWMRRKDSCSSIELDHTLSEEDEEILNFSTSPKESVPTNECDIIDVPDSEPRDFSILDVQDKIGKQQELLNFPTSPKEDRVSTEGFDVIDIPASDEPRDFSVLDVGDVTEKPQGLLNPPASPKEDLVSTEGCEVNEISDSDPRVKTPTKAEKPKRRLLPASSLLLRDFSSLDIEDGNEKPKGGKKKSGVEEIKRTQGSISLMRTLHRNLRR